MTKLNSLAKWILLIFCGVTLWSCEDNMHISIPKGITGENGLTDYEIWKHAVGNGTITWDQSQTDLVDYYLFLKGEKGDDGKGGANGKSAYELWVKEVESGNIKDPQTGKPWDKSKTSIQDFWEYLNGADGKNGSVPTMNENTGTWWIGNTDTKIPYNGKNGNSSDLLIIIGGNWYINQQNTYIEAHGKSAYERWVEDVLTGTLVDPHEPTQYWNTSKTTLTDFWEYLRGVDGKDGENY